jgi:superfamily I DNA/RNA helicase
LSTIHGAKGGEADNVLLYLDLSGKALTEMERNPDDAYRVLYVGITRTKENLILKMSENSQQGWNV